MPDRALLWDVFCRVIDNHGDLGVCWRLARDLGQRGHSVRLWVDDPSALGWMAPHLTWRGPASQAQATGQQGVTVHAWPADSDALPWPRPGDVVIEAFGCDPPAPFVARMQRPTPPQWVNLEYLSAEPYVERSHGLPSPVLNGPGQGLSKRFFYPGFTRATGGLPREPDLMAQQQQFRAHERLPWLGGLGVAAAPDDHLVSVFCYDSAPLLPWLQALAADALCQANATRVLLTPGPASQMAHAWLQQTDDTHRHALHLHWLPHLPQPAFDALLWSCDLNLVRGEDSAVRALWAGRPHLWQLYPQHDGAHHEKLDAFLARWTAGWPAPLQTAVAQHMRWFNGQAAAAVAGACPPLPNWRPRPGGIDTRPPPQAWREHAQAARAELLSQTDLVTQLTHFVGATE